MWGPIERCGKKRPRSRARVRTSALPCRPASAMSQCCGTSVTSDDRAPLCSARRSKVAPADGEGVELGDAGPRTSRGPARSHCHGRQRSTADVTLETSSTNLQWELDHLGRLGIDPQGASEPGVSSARFANGLKISKHRGQGVDPPWIRRGIRGHRRWRNFEPSSSRSDNCSGHALDAGDGARRAGGLVGVELLDGSRHIPASRSPVLRGGSSAR